ncbi:DUF4395 domain-containing protein [Mesorhizobium japonicum]|uniref:DUF4395 domain-containing protein n=1 Tax=Mesorhizobium japonicum TaxID=2066070 RepID=UPI003B59C037
MSQPDAARAGIDPRGPRFGAGITAVLLLVDVFLGVAGVHGVALILLAALAVIFGWGAFAGIQRHPYGLLFKALIRPRLKPPAELEDPVPPTFAQGVGLVITGLGAILGIVFPVVVPIAAALAFIAAFLNSVFGLCLGCQLYLLLVRVGVIHRRSATA